MPQNLAELRQMLSRVKPWAGVAAILAVVLLGYFLVQGWRYLQASGDISPLTQEIRKLNNSMILMDRAEKAAQEKLAKQKLEEPRPEAELRDMFSRRSAENLMAIVAATASKSAVELSSMSPGIPGTQVLGELQYQVQSLSVSVEGATVDLYRFLVLLHASVPVVSASEIRIDNLQESPSAQVQLVFYLSPESIEEQEDGG